MFGKHVWEQVSVVCVSQYNLHFTPAVKRRCFLSNDVHRQWIWKKEKLSGLFSVNTLRHTIHLCVFYSSSTPECLLLFPGHFTRLLAPLVSLCELEDLQLFSSKAPASPLWNSAQYPPPTSSHELELAKRAKRRSDKSDWNGDRQKLFPINLHNALHIFHKKKNHLGRNPSGM